MDAKNKNAKNFTFFNKQLSLRTQQNVSFVKIPRAFSTDVLITISLISQIKPYLKIHISSFLLIKSSKLFF